MSDWNIDDDRRRSYRIEERAAINYKALPAEYAQPLETLFPESPAFALISDLRELDQDAETLIRQVAEEDKATAAYLRLLDRKINRLAQALTQPEADKNHCFISLSEGGLSFLSNRSLSLGLDLAIKLLLLPEGNGIIVKARTIYSSEQQGAFRCGCEFIQLADPHRSLIARHIIEQQARERRRIKEKRDFPS